MDRKLKLKICGMRELENIRSIATLLPDYMGFIFYKNSPRYVGDNFQMPQRIPDSIEKVGVFVNEFPERVHEMVCQYKLNCIQLHGDESVDVCKAFKSENIKVIKAFSIHDDFDFNSLKPFESVVDFFLFDTKGKFYGGNNQTFNWDLLKKYNQHIPFFLSGGLSSANIQNVISLSAMNLHALDFNSGVEISTGIKSLEKIQTITQFLFLTTES